MSNDMKNDMSSHVNNEEQQLIRETLNRLLGDLCTPEVIDRAELGQWPTALWQALVETGLVLAGIPESAGGSGGSPQDSMLVIREAGRHAAPIPIAEHFMVATLLGDVDPSLLALPSTIATGDFNCDGNHIIGSACAVPFARWCTNLLVPAIHDAKQVLCLVPLADCNIEERTNIAGEPRDDVSMDTDIDPTRIFTAPDNILQTIRLMGAATRSVMMAGALETVLELSVAYSLERSQFGKPIAKFQAIQQQLAILAGEVAASTMAGHAVTSAINDLQMADIAIGKARIGEAIAVCTDIAHQVHGAMGYTKEHRLNHATRRLWAWRDEYGAEREWQIKLGEQMLAAGADNLWAQITERV